MTTMQTSRNCSGNETLQLNTHTKRTADVTHGKPNIGEVQQRELKKLLDGLPANAEIRQFTDVNRLAQLLVERWTKEGKLGITSESPREDIKAGAGAPPSFREEGSVVNTPQKIQPDTEQNLLRHFHGSGSASLIDTLTMGLIPSGELAAKGLCSYCGEGGLGLAGINKHALSVVPSLLFRKALEYSYESFNLNGWNPTKGNKQIERENEKLEDFNRLPPHDPKRSYFSKYDLEYPQLRIALEQRRIARWDSLSPYEKQLIEHPFPILYGIVDGKVLVETVNSSIGGEEAIGAVAPNRLIVFVPTREFAALQKYAKLKGSSVIIMPSDKLRQHLPKSIGYNDEGKAKDGVEKYYDKLILPQRQKIEDPTNIRPSDKDQVEKPVRQGSPTCEPQDRNKSSTQKLIRYGKLALSWCQKALAYAFKAKE